jgi:hypothetical protein
MFGFQSSLRELTSWLLIGALSGIVPLTAAPPPGTPASSGAAALGPLTMPLLDVAHLAAMPRSDQQTATPATSSGATPTPKHRLSRWAWVAIVAGVGVGVGAAIIVSNHQAGKTAVIPPTATLGAGSVSAGPP